MQKKIPLVDLIKFLGNSVIGIIGDATAVYIHYLREPTSVDKFTLDWVNHNRTDKQHMAENSLARAIITDSSVQYTDKLKMQKKVLICVENPKLAIAKIGNQFFVSKPETGIHPTAIIHPDAKIGSNVYIGPYAILGTCNIGNHVQIHENVLIGDKVIVNDHVILHSNVTVGAEGLGCEREKDGSLVKFPHMGGVVLEERVELGANTVIAKGALSDTIIGRGSKVNADCYVAHNVKIGENVWISPKAIIAGSVNIGKNTTIFSGVIIRDQQKIGQDVIIGMGAVVTTNIPNGETWIGNPARKLTKNNETKN